MGVMGFLRERMGKILAFFIGFALLAFIIGEVARSGSSFFRDDRNTLGEVSGDKVAYDQFNKKVEQNSAQFKQQSGQAALSPQIMSYVNLISSAAVPISLILAGALQATFTISEICKISAYALTSVCLLSWLPFQKWGKELL